MTGIWDPGLQVERTALAWQRTCLLLALVGGVTARYGVESGHDVAVFVGGAVIAVSLVAYALVHRRYRQSSHQLTTSDTLPAAAPVTLLVAFGSTLVAAVVLTILISETFA